MFRLKGKPWTVEEENTLARLVREGKSARAISDVMCKSRDAVNQKIARLDLEVVDGGSAPLSSTTTSLELPKKLSSEEASLRMENAALIRLCEAGLTKTEIMRLQAIGNMGKNYRDGLAEYLKHRQLEVRLVAMEKKYEEICKKYEEVSREYEALREKMESAATRENKKVDASGEVSSSDSSSKSA